jgi:hypothetical protein
MIYRDADDALRLRRDELLAERLRQLDGLHTDAADAVRVFTRRHGRSTAGLVGIAFAFAVVIAAVTRREGLTYVLWAAWPAMIVAYAAGATYALFLLRWRLTGAFSPQNPAATDDLGEDVARLEDQTPAGLLDGMCRSLEMPSIARPMVALSLLAPLTIHYLAGSLLQLRPLPVEAFDSWISICLLLVGHGHIILAVYARRFARDASATADPETLDLLAGRSAWHAWGLIVAWSLVPGVVVWLFLPFVGHALILPLASLALLVITPALVAATATIFVPLMFGVFTRRLKAERAVLAALPAAPEMM